MKRRAKSPEWERIAAIFDEEMRTVAVGGRIPDFRVPVGATIKRLAPHPSNPKFGDYESLLFEFLWRIKSDIAKHIAPDAKRIPSPDGESEGVSPPLQMTLDEWSGYRTRLIDRHDDLGVHREFVDAIDTLARSRGADPMDKNHRLGDYVTEGEYQELRDEYLNGEEAAA